jgi:hypothetical protein
MFIPANAVGQSHQNVLRGMSADVMRGEALAYEVLSPRMGTIFTDVDPIHGQKNLENHLRRLEEEAAAKGQEVLVLPINPDELLLRVAAYTTVNRSTLPA